MSLTFKTKLDPSSRIFVELKSGKYPWWDNIKNNKNISIQVRKGNTLDVYYNGGAILNDLRYNDAEQAFTACIHPKYIPLKDESQYKSLTLSANGVEFTGTIDAMELSQLEGAKLKAIMNRVKKYYDSGSEKAIQYQFVANDPYIIDTEFQIKKQRIDLVRLDERAKKIVLIEVKTTGDRRLFAESGKGKENIRDQFKKYYEFFGYYQQSIIDYYVKVLQIKKDLGLAGPGVKKLTINDWQIEWKPLLVFGDCEQAWIDKNAADIDRKLWGVAYGAYYFGEPKYPLNLLKKSRKNQHVF